MSRTQMPDPTSVQREHPSGMADGIGLTVLDAVEVGGTWTVPLESEAQLEAPKPERRRRVSPWWLRGAAASCGLGLVLLLAIGLNQLLMVPGASAPDQPAAPIAPAMAAPPAATPPGAAP